MQGNTNLVNMFEFNKAQKLCENYHFTVTLTLMAR